MRKARTDNVIRFDGAAPRSEAQLADIARIGESMTLEAACGQLALPEEMGGYEIEVSQATLGKFLAEWRSENFRAKLKEAAATAAEVDGALTDEDGRRIDDAILGGLREWILDSIVQRQISAKDAKSLIGLIQTGKKHDIEERKLALLERKAAQADEAVGVVNDSKLTPEERESRFREIFGIA